MRTNVPLIDADGTGGVIRVIPPKLRSLVPLDGGRFATSDPALDGRSARAILRYEGRHAGTS